MCLYTDTHTYIHYLQVVIITPDGGSWGYPYINPLSPKSDQDQFSPNNIHTLSRDKVMRINKDYQRENALILHQILSTNS